jgi:predicted nuclease of predicted toxin-antitoxin system
MKFMIDRCAGRRLAEWLSSRGHDVIETRSLGQDPGDRVILEWVAEENRILVTIDTDFGQLVYVNGARHCGIVRLPDVPVQKRIQLMEEVITRYRSQLETGQLITVRGDKIRVSKPIH